MSGIYFIALVTFATIGFCYSMTKIIPLIWPPNKYTAEDVFGFFFFLLLMGIGGLALWKFGELTGVL